MAKMIPDYIDQEDPRRNGERMVFDWFSNKDIPGTVYYSIHQKNHKKKLIGEVDFLYVSKRGFLCVEVKGGEDIYRKDRQWFSVNKNGVHNEIHNPFYQALQCQNALKDLFKDTYGKFSAQANYLVGYAVIFPECRFTGDGNDLVTEVMFDGRYNVLDFLAYLDKVFDYWEKLEKERHNYTPSKLTEDQLRQANDLLRGDFHVVPSMHLELQHVDQKMAELLEEQYDVLDVAEDNSRVIIQGAAGTGKTLLALELARKNAAKGKKVLYVCYNSNMAEYAEASTKDCLGVEVRTYHSLMMELLEDMSLFKLAPTELAKMVSSKKNEIKQRYSLIIIDEGQDLFFAEVFESVGTLLEGGLEKGRWVVFLDPNQNIFHPNEEFEQAMEYIRELYHPAMLSLKTNCRNTQPIASRTSALTITPPAKNLKLSGPKVVTKTYHDSMEFKTTFTKELQSLLASGISANDIVVLSRYKKDNSLLAGIKTLCNLNVVEQTSIKTFRDRSLNFYTVQSFKGLESKIVFYIDVDGFASIEDRMMNYVAMSRACLRLYLFYDEARKQDYQDTLDKGTDLLG